VPNRDAFACNLNYDRVCVNSGASIITLQLSLRGKEIARSPRNPSTSTSALPSSESEGHRHVSFQQTLWWFHFCNRSIKSPAFAQVREIREVRGFATGFFRIHLYPGLQVLDPYNTAWASANVRKVPGQQNPTTTCTAGCMLYSTMALSQQYRYYLVYRRLSLVLVTGSLINLCVRCMCWHANCSHSHGTIRRQTSRSDASRVSRSEIRLLSFSPVVP
jgi:hypothetical protein